MEQLRRPGDYRDYVTDFDNIRIDRNAMAFTIAVVPKGKDIPQPPSAPKLPELGTVDGGTAITVPEEAGVVDGTVSSSTNPAPSDPSVTVAASTPRAATDSTTAATSTTTGLMRAVVLVGGFGTRLRPLTNSVPKPMLPVVHVPIIERLVANLARGGVTEVTLGLGFRPEPFIEAFPDATCAGVDLRYAVEPEPLDTAGAIRFAADAAGLDDTFVVANGDILTDLDIAALVAFHRQRSAEATIHLTPVEDPSAFGVVALDADGRVERFVEKPAGVAPSNLVNAGTYVLEASILQRIPAGERTSIERVTFPAVAAEGRLFAMSTDDAWIDTGRPELYLQANLDELDRDPTAGVHPSADVAADATIERSVVGPDVTVAAGAFVAGSVLLPGAVVGAGAVVRDSVVMGRVAPGGRVERCVIGATGTVDDGERVSDERRPPPAA